MSATMEHKHGKESVRALLYFAVMTVFVRASLAGPSINIPSYGQLVEPEILSTLDLSTSDESMSSTTSDKFDLIRRPNNAGIFGTMLASTSALFKGQST